MNFHIVQSPTVSEKKLYKSVIIQETPENIPLYDSDEGNSTTMPSSSTEDEAYFNDIKLIKALYSCLLYTSRCV